MIYPTPRAAILMAIGLPVTLIIAVIFPALWALGAAWIAGLVGLIILDVFLSIPRKKMKFEVKAPGSFYICLLYTSPSPRDKRQSRMPSSA